MLRPSGTQGQISTSSLRQTLPLHHLNLEHTAPSLLPETNAAHHPEHLLTSENRLPQGTFRSGWTDQHGWPAASYDICDCQGSNPRLAGVREAHRRLRETEGSFLARVEGDYNSFCGYWGHLPQLAACLHTLILSVQHTIILHNHTMIKTIFSLANTLAKYHFPHSELPAFRPLPSLRDAARSSFRKEQTRSTCST